MPHDFAPYYPAAYYGGRHGATAGFCLRRRLRWIERGTEGPVGTGVLLDIGCGDGSFLLAAQARGWRVAGVERFPDDARKKGLAVVNDVRDLQSPCMYLGSGFRNPGFRPKAPLFPCPLNSDLSTVALAQVEPCSLPPLFDCITLWHSLEHLADPVALLKEAAALLKPGGRVVVAVPDFGGWQARLLGRHWLHLDVPRHLWHFTQPALCEAFRKAGLEVVRLHHQEFEYDLLGWSQSALNALFKTPNVFFHWLTKKPTGVGRPMLALQVGLGFLLTCFSVPLVWAGALCRRGGTLVVVGSVSARGTEGTAGT